MTDNEQRKLTQVTMRVIRMHAHVIANMIPHATREALLERECSIAEHQKQIVLLRNRQEEELLNSLVYSIKTSQ